MHIPYSYNGHQSTAEANILDTFNTNTCKRWDPPFMYQTWDGWIAAIMSHLTQNRSFWRRSSQPIFWLGTEKTNPTKLTTQNQSDLN